jgi:hypothetical protein
MKYILVCEVRKREVRQFHKDLINKVHSKFGVSYSYYNDYPSHFTLKYHFKKNSLKEVEKLLKNLSKELNKGDLIIGGVYNFRKDVLFLKVKPLKNSKDIYARLILGLKKIRKLPWDKKYDADLINNFHLTIARKDLTPRYDEVKKFLNSYNSKKFRVKFDNFSILEKKKDKWKLYKRFKLK